MSFLLLNSRDSTRDLVDAPFRGEASFGAWILLNSQVSQP